MCFLLCSPFLLYQQSGEWHAQWNDSCETQIGNPKSFPFASEICINDCKLFFQRSSQRLAVSTLVCNFQSIIYDNLFLRAKMQNASFPIKTDSLSLKIHEMDRIKYEFVQTLWQSTNH